ncbi:AtzE family amidohydrolase [Polymorphum gilvum]|uniref:Aspartyl-tRNA(Asn)/glutamyl-tRNA (Gln) amidotransferase subunit A n=1 Tax=Polymorphum gilvum (strain LMG 25793 / CGMCC 1.9160 / SL003B-26A1) TaxID=991905 RepID=F2IWR2_POLGS|nr:AtzE family amidohydrolase [Polymorphum gilvum]ADZ70387.1 Aspartyl-tRNA(Asn)/glutamyl-tRNA (Gln) amidotransferase subunit A [Polymorphum gilvum SL003B-26A1]
MTAPAAETGAWTATQTAAAVRSGAVRAREVAEAALVRVERLNPKVNAFTDIAAPRALAEADKVDAALSAGADLPLAGVPFAVKNLFDIAGLPTRAGSKINLDNPPAASDAFLIERLTEAGAVLLGGLHMGEYAYDFTGENAHDGNCRNPHDLTRMTGGSSSGSAAAVASGMVPASLGSDTNGSIRVPSSFCGLFGLKPTFGRLSRRGTYPFVASLDHLGPFARSVEDLALLFDVLQGADPADPAQAARPALACSDDLGKGIDGLRVAAAGGYFRQNGEPQAFAAVDRVAAALGAGAMVEVPEAARARAAAYVITTAESAALHLPRLRGRPEDFDPETRDRFLSGAMVPAVWVQQAQRLRAWFRAQMAALFERIDILLAPATPFPALPSGTRTITLGGEAMPARPNIGLFTQPISFIGLPVVAVPVWLDGETLPIGVQVVAPPWREDLALRAAFHLQSTGVCAAPVAAIP